MAFCNRFKFFGRIACTATKQVNTNGRLCSTEVKDVVPLTIRLMRKSRQNTIGIGSWILLTIPASSFGLGVWQIFRKFEKDKEIEKFLEKTKQPPVDFPKNLDELKNMEFCAVRVKGRFDHSKEIYLGPRPLIEEKSLTETPSLLSKSRGGYVVITPFKLSDRNLTILVNRGWVSSNQKLPDQRPEGQITDEVELIGLVRNQESRLPFGAKNNSEKGVWVYRDIFKMAEVCGTDPVFLDAAPSTTVPGGPIGGQTIVQFKNDHLSYIVTWFSLSVVSAYLWYIGHLRKLKRR